VTGDQTCALPISSSMRKLRQNSQPTNRSRISDWDFWWRCSEVVMTQSPGNGDLGSDRRTLLRHPVGCWSGGGSAQLTIIGQRSCRPLLWGGGAVGFRVGSATFL